MHWNRLKRKVNNMKENEIDDIVENVIDLPFGITDEEYDEIKGDIDDTN